MAVDRTVVGQMPLFSELAPPEVEDLLRETKSARFAKDRHVFGQGDEAGQFHLLLHGHLRVEKMTPHGQKIVVRYISPGELFGVAQAIGLRHYPATAIAAVDSLVLSWPAAAWQRLMARFPSLAAIALRTVGQRLLDTQTRVMEMSGEQVEQRIAHALLRLGRQAGRKVGGGTEINFPISRQNIAEMTGTTLHTVSRTLSGWEHQGLVEGGRQRIVLRDTHKLFALAEGIVPRGREDD